MNTTLLISVACVVTLLFLVVVAWGYFVRLARFERVVERVAQLSLEFVHMRERVALVETSAVDYVNSIGREGVVALEQIQKRIDDLAALLNELEALVASGQPSAITEVELYLANKHPRQERIEREFDGTIRDFRFNPFWSSELEGLLQQLGKSVSQASLAATAVGLPKRRERKSTIQNLMRAGIDNFFRKPE